MSDEPDISKVPFHSAADFQRHAEPNLADRHPNTVHLATLFEFGHLPPHLQTVSAKCADLATAMIQALPDGPELSAGLRKLVEAKDCFVRAAVAAAKASSS